MVGGHLSEDPVEVAMVAIFTTDLDQEALAISMKMLVAQKCADN